MVVKIIVKVTYVNCAVNVSLFVKLLNQRRYCAIMFFCKQTVFQLSEQYGISRNTVRKLDIVRVPRIISSSKNIVVFMDATYWGT